jgi:flagellar protein FlaI
MDQKMMIALKNNPHLRDYLSKVKKERGKQPEFHQQVSRDMFDPEGFDLLYPVGDPIFIHAYGSKRDGFFYKAVEPILTKEENNLKNQIVEHLFLKAGYEPVHRNKQEFEMMIDKLVNESIKIIKKGDPRTKKTLLNPKPKVAVRKSELTKIRYYIKRDILESGPLEPLLRDPYIEDIHAIGIEPFFIIHKVFKTMKTNIQFRSANEADGYLRGMSERIGKPVSMARPIIDAALPDGSRLNLIYSDDVSIKGPSFTIRKFATEPLSIVQLVKWKTLSSEVAAYLWLALENGMSIFVCGETASGKTTTLNGMLPFIKHNAKIFTVEDTAEAKPPHEIWQQLLTREAVPEESRVDMFALLKAALRSRPNYIIVGEIRGREGAIAFQAMQTGHPVIATFHAATIIKMIQRFSGDPINVPIRFMDNLNIALFQMAVYQKGKTLRRVLGISEIIGYSKELGGVLTKEVFHWNPTRDVHRFRGRNNSYILENKIAMMQGLEDKRDIYKQMDLRARIIDELAVRNIVKYKEVRDIVFRFQMFGVESLPFELD